MAQIDNYPNILGGLASGIGISQSHLGNGIYESQLSAQQMKIIHDAEYRRFRQQQTSWSAPGPIQFVRNESGLELEIPGPFPPTLRESLQKETDAWLKGALRWT